MKNGVPFDVAFALYPEESIAYGVIFGQFENPKATFDFAEGRWILPD